MKTGTRRRAFCAAFCLFAFLAYFAYFAAAGAPRAFAGNTGDLDKLLKEVDALEAAATVQGLKDLGVGDLAALQAALEAARSQAKGKQVHEVREAMMKTAQVVLDGMLKSKQEAIEKLATQRFATRQAYYAADHLALSGGVWNDLTQKIADLSKLLAGANALSFLASGDTASGDSSGTVDSKFGTYYPGYSGQILTIDFSQEYKQRMSEWEKYAFGTLSANNKEALDIKDNLLNLLSKLNDASSTLSTSGIGYRQLLQARNQIYIFVAQEVANMRIDVMRQIEARARFAANRQQKRTNERVAFGKAVPTLASQSQGKNY